MSILALLFVDMNFYLRVSAHQRQCGFEIRRKQLADDRDLRAPAARADSGATETLDDASVRGVKGRRCSLTLLTVQTPAAAAPGYFPYRCWRNCCGDDRVCLAD
jgi:hypothetical protein